MFKFTIMLNIKLKQWYNMCIVRLIEHIMLR